MDSIINYQNVDIHIEKQTILKGVNLTIKPRDFVFVTGKVGSGKTTLFRTFYGMRPIKSGSAFVLGYDMKKLKMKQAPELRRRIGIVFQDYQLLPNASVYANLEFVLKATGWKKNAMTKRIEEVLNQMQLIDKANNFPHELSGGEQQRTAIARAILNKPELIIADEPTGNLDAETGKQILEILYNLSKNGSAVIMCTHNLNLIELVEARTYECGDQELKLFTRFDNTTQHENS